MSKKAKKAAKRTAYIKRTMDTKAEVKDTKTEEKKSEVKDTKTEEKKAEVKDTKTEEKKAAINLPIDILTSNKSIAEQIKSSREMLLSEYDKIPDEKVKKLLKDFFDGLNDNELFITLMSIELCEKDDNVDTIIKTLKSSLSENNSKKLDDILDIVLQKKTEVKDTKTEAKKAEMKDTKVEKAINILTYLHGLKKYTKDKRILSGIDLAINNCDPNVFIPEGIKTLEDLYSEIAMSTYQYLPPSIVASSILKDVCKAIENHYKSSISWIEQGIRSNLVK